MFYGEKRSLAVIAQACVLAALLMARHRVAGAAMSLPALETMHKSKWTYLILQLSLVDLHVARLQRNESHLPK